MRDKKIFVLKIVWMKSLASLHRLTQAVQRANLRRTAGDTTWVYPNFVKISSEYSKIFLPISFVHPMPTNLFYISLRVGAIDTMPRRRNGWIVAWNIDHLKLFDHVSIFGTFEKDSMTSL